jgi:hypothetical protein
MRNASSRAALKIGSKAICVVLAWTLRDPRGPPRTLSMRPRWEERGRGEEGMGRKRSIGVLAAALLLSGLLVESGYGGPAPVASSQVIRLINGDVLRESSYSLRDGQDERMAVITLYRGDLQDEDGNGVGSHRCDCVSARGIGATCTHILSLRSGPYTEHGQVVITGPFRGFSGERLAITGGTGAYASARGYATSTVDGDAFVTTLYLVP